MSLKTYSWLVVMVGVAVAAVGWLGLPGAMAILVGLACLLAHVAGNAIGTSIRDATDRDLAGKPEEQSVVVIPPRDKPTLLEKGGSLGKLVPVSAGIGAICGGVAGTTCLILLVGSTLPGAVLGGISSAVIGGIGGFLLASFVEVLRTALTEADRNEQLQRHRPPAG